MLPQTMTAAGTCAAAWIHLQQRALLSLGRMGSKLHGAQAAAHLQTGLRGEQEALFYLRKAGYTVVARRWTSGKLRGDIDLIAWEGDWLCFVEVKTRSERNLADPAEAAVDREKQRILRRMARAYLRSFPEDQRREVAVRFDVVSVYLGRGEPVCELFRAAFGWR